MSSTLPKIIYELDLFFSGTSTTGKVSRNTDYTNPLWGFLSLSVLH